MLSAAQGFSDRPPQAITMLYRVLCFINYCYLSSALLRRRPAAVREDVQPEGPHLRAEQYKFIVFLVFSTISTLDILTLLVPIMVVTSPNFPGSSGREIQSVVLYIFSFTGFLFSLYCQYLRIAALAFPVFVLVNQCKDGETFFDVIILTTSPYLKID